MEIIIIIIDRKGKFLNSLEKYIFLAGKQQTHMNEFKKKIMATQFSK
jgi:hypothetical protein